MARSIETLAISWSTHYVSLSILLPFRMLMLPNWLNRRKTTATDDDGAAALREAVREAQELRLELAERDEMIARLRAEAAVAHREQAEVTAEALRKAEGRLLADLAGPVAQLLTQAHLVHVAHQPVRAADVLSVASRLIAALQDRGLEIVGGIGEVVPYDPERHQLLGSGDIAPAPGEAAVIRFVGLAHGGCTIHRVAVEPIPGARDGDVA